MDISSDPPTLKDFTPEQIRAITREACALKAGTPEKRLNQMREAYPDFWYRYPKLLDTCCQGSMDVSQLEFMLSMLTSVGSQQQTLESANKEVQDRLAGAYLPKSMLDAAAAAAAAAPTAEQAPLSG